MFGIKRVLLIAAFAVLYYFLFFRLNVGIPEYDSRKVWLQTSLELLERYGENLEESEYQDLSELFRDIEESAVDAWIKENEAFQQYGMESYRDWAEGVGDLPDDIASSLSSQILTGFTEEEKREAWEIACREMHLDMILKAYEEEARSDRLTTYYSEIPEQAEKRVAERNREEVYSLMPYTVMNRYRSILSDFALFLFLSMLFLIVPYSVKDTVEGIPILQYTSQKGCRYYWKKLTAVFIGAFLLCVAETGWLALMLGVDHTFSFAGCFVSGFSNPFITFVKLTFGQYIAMSLVYVAIIALCLAMVAYCLSSWARNYVSAIALQIPAVIFSFVLAFGFMCNFAEISQNRMLLCIIPCICMFAAGIGNVVRFLAVRYYGQF